MATRSAVRAIALLAIIIFIVNGFIAGMLPGYVAAIPVELTLPIFGAMFVAVIATDWVEKNLLKQFM